MEIHTYHSECIFWSSIFNATAINFLLIMSIVTNVRDTLKFEKNIQLLNENNFLNEIRGPIDLTVVRKTL